MGNTLIQQMNLVRANMNALFQGQRRGMQHGVQIRPNQHIIVLE